MPDVDTALLSIVWHDSPYTGAMDVLPLEWFSKEGVLRDRMHLVRAAGARSIGREKAKCNVRVRGAIADLDYEAFPAFNGKRENVLGVMRLQFESKKRLRPVQVLWRGKGEASFRPFSTTIGREEPRTSVTPNDVDLLQLAGSEGAKRLVLHLRRERRAKLVAAKKASVVAAGYPLACEACGFCFGKQYGKLGASYCEIHHRRQLADGEERATTLNDLAILCSNCHRMIHRTQPMLSVQSFAKRHLAAGLKWRRNLASRRPRKL
jgi:5-methylcytosine-specific restriction endonuclease McrA